VFGWLKRLFAPRRPVDVQYEQAEQNPPPIVPAAPPTTPYPPAAPIETSMDQDESSS